MQKIKGIYLNDKKKKKLLLLCGSFFLAMIALISLVSISLAALTPAESIEILSSNLNYGNLEQGSWKIKKSATWLSKGKIKVNYDISTVKKGKDTNVDLLLVVNTSNSLSDEQFSNMKNGLKEFTNGVLTDGSSSRMALLSFNSTYSIISNFSDDSSSIIEGIDNLTVDAGSSYYKGFLGIDEVLSNYQPISGNNLVVIFLTNSLPNKDMPNENAQYNYLKAKYSNLVINAVTYDMSSSIPDKVKNISDNQFIAGSDNLGNTLFSATDMQYNYERFTIDDYIDTDNFNIENLDSLKINYGSATLGTDSTGKKVSINLNNLISGNSVNVSYEMDLINDSTDKVFAVNKSIKVKTAIVESLEDIVSEKTPVIADNYKVSYISNAPDGCSVTVPSAKYYSVFENVKINDDLVCNGYQFRGWEVVADKDVTMINDDNFLMPEADVSIKGTWSKLSITKSMDGTVYTPQTLNNIIENQAVLDNTASEYVTAETGIDFSKEASGTNGKGVYTMASTKDDEFPIHYYRGNVTNNFVKFAGLCWRIVRTTDTGGVKLVYYGKPNSSTGACSSASSIGSYKFNSSSNALTDVGYMYGDRYANNSSKINDHTWYGLNDHKLEGKNAYDRSASYDSGVASTLFGSKKYYFASGITYNSDTNTYTLTSPSKDYVNLLHTNAVGKYTCHSTSATSCTSVGYVVNAQTGAYYYISMTGGETRGSIVENLQSTKWLYGKGVTYDATTNTYTLTDTLEDQYIYYSYENILNQYPYSCLSDSDTCSTVAYFFDKGLGNFIPSTVNYISMTGGETYDSLYANAISDQYTYMYGADVSYDSDTGLYTLTDPISSHWIDWNSDKDNILSSHHYFCTDNQSSCSMVNYAYYYTSILHYFSFSEGKKIVDVINTFNVNKNDSTAKKTIDKWYTSNLLNYKNYFEDTIWCNDRKIIDSAGLELSNSISGTSIKFAPYGRLYTDKVPSLMCSNVSDKFSVNETIGNGKLDYPIGLLTVDELILSGASTNSSDITVSYLSNVTSISPERFDTMAYIYELGSSDKLISTGSSNSFSIYPSISLKNGLMVYAGDGTSDYPYILENLAKKIVIDGNDDIKASPGVALPGETINLVSKSGIYRVISFDLNGETISGSSFTMPDGNAVVSNITVIEGKIFESEHNPYPNSLNNVIYGEHTFEGATSLNVEITYQTQITSYDWIYIYDSSGSTVGGKLGGTTKTTKTLTVNGNYIKIVFRTDNYNNDYYGFKAIVIPNYG